MTVKDRKDHLRVTLAELERLIDKAGQSGAPIERWVEQLVVELRAAMPEETPPPGAELAYRILSDPHGSLDAHAPIDAEAIRSLKALIVAGSA